MLRHELRTPLTGILGMSELLQASGLAGEQRRIVLALQESGRQMERLIDRMAVHAPTSIDDAATRFEPLNGLRMLEQVIRAHWPPALKKGIGLYLVFDHRLAENWHSDAASLRQLLDNLLANAIKFTHRGYVLVEAVPAAPYGQGPYGVELRVRDTGIGIARRDGRRIYSAREQGSANGSRHYGGSGLGLFVCSKITAFLGGSVQHRPNAGGGTSFKVVLPGIAGPVPGSAPRLRPSLLTCMQGQLALAKPVNRVVAHWLRRIGVQATFSRNHELDPLPSGCDFVICDSNRMSASPRWTQAAAGHGRPVLLSPHLPPGKKVGGQHEIGMLELPQPILYSNLEPLLLQLALQRAMHARL